MDQNSFDNLQKLCRIKCTKDEEKELLHALQSILKYIEQLNELDTENVEPCRHVLMNMQKNIFRQDIVKETLLRETFLENAPEQIGGMIKVPPILKST
ncbi:MAG: Asp-tRNA(Asn)/Glu-tRNA(Gln) amidotransferase subunit GatC [Chlamydiae bacterium]|nr:Asp-tRNA(Asn)/Glu-tRNA(Gln) amidotransferase subunit GatC [Chlamydiota bacterium]